MRGGRTTQLACPQCEYDILFLGGGWGGLFYWYCSKTTAACVDMCTYTIYRWIPLIRLTAHESYHCFRRNHASSSSPPSRGSTLPRRRAAERIIKDQSHDHTLGIPIDVLTRKKLQLDKHDSAPPQSIIIDHTYSREFPTERGGPGRAGGPQGDGCTRHMQ